TFGMADHAAHVIAFILILIIVPLLLNLAGWLVSKLLQIICLGWINRLLGGIIGVLKFALFVGIVITGIEFFDKHNTLISEGKKENSILYYPIYDATGIFFNGIKENLKEFDS
ncbi:MAG: CvpA family protein, partial [Bacteroidaceae bacterium]|nr:CvpA family protein [Bacteroidaceae bacterium]